MKKDRIYKSKTRVRICWKGKDKTLLKWLDDPRCPLTNRQLRRRVTEHLYGQLNMSIEDILTKPCLPNKPTAKIRDWREESQAKIVKRSKAEEWQRLCSQVATGVTMSPRLAEGRRMRKMAEGIRGNCENIAG